MDEAGVKDFTWHCLRHTFGSRLAARGVDLRKIQELMGHKDIKMTVRYTHLSQQDLLAAVEQVDDGKVSTSARRGVNPWAPGRTATNPSMRLSDTPGVVQ